MPPVTLIIPVAPGQIVTGVLPSVDAMQVESVYATIDASGGGPVTPELLIADPSGQVIATKRQSDSIPAGDTGSATWALRLGADGGAAAAAGGLEFIDDAFGQVLGGGVSAALRWVHGSGAALLDLTDPLNPLVIAAGTYAFSTVMTVTPIGVFTAGRAIGGNLAFQILGDLPSGVGGQVTWPPVGPANPIVSATAVRTLPAGTLVNYFGINGQPVNGTFFLAALVQRLA